MFYGTTKLLKSCFLSGRQCLHFYQVKITRDISIFCKLTSNFTMAGLLILNNKSKRLCPQGQNQMSLGKPCETCFSITLKGNWLIFCVISKFWILFLNMEFDLRGAANFSLQQNISNCPAHTSHSTRLQFPLIGDTLGSENKTEGLPPETSMKNMGSISDRNGRNERLLY